MGTRPKARNQRDGVDMYDDGRFFTLMGAHVERVPGAVKRREDALCRVHTDYVQATSGDEGANVGTAVVAENMGADGDAAAPASEAVLAVKDSVYPEGWCGPTVSGG